MTFNEAVLLLEAEKQKHTILDRVKQLPQDAQDYFHDVEAKYGTISAWGALVVAGLVPGGLVGVPLALKGADQVRKHLGYAKPEPQPAAPKFTLIRR